MITIELHKIISADIDEIRTCLLDHSRLDRFFNAKFSLIKAENESEMKGGKGAVRQVTMKKNMFLEEVVMATDFHIRYQIIGKGPVTTHQGDVFLSRVADNESLIKYLIVCEGPKGAPDFIVKWVIERGIKKGLKKIAKHFS